MVANKLVSQYKIYVEMAFLSTCSPVYKTFEAEKQEMTIFPKLFN